MNSIHLSANVATPLNAPPTPSENQSQANLEPNTAEAATDFEAVFMSMLVKELRDTVEGGLFGEESSDTLGAIFDLYMGKHLAESKSLGVEKAVTTYLERSSKQ